MKLIEQQLKTFIDAVDSKSPAPGGGSVSALYGTLGIALVRMVGHLTVDRKKFLKLDEDTQQSLISKQMELLQLKEQIIQLIDEDTEAFNAIMAAYALPKSTPSEEAIRAQAIVHATQQAINVPQKIANLSLRALEDLDVILTHGNASAISDVGVGVLGIAAAVEGACLNILINLPGLKDDHQIHAYRQEVETMIKQTHHIKKHLFKHIHEQLGA